METERRAEDRREERSPAEILEDHGRQSIERINKIDAWVKRVSYMVIGLSAFTLVLVLVMAFAFNYLSRQIDDSRWETAVKGCQINRQASHDSISALMTSLAKTEQQKVQAAQLADHYYKYDRDSCEKYAQSIGLTP